MDTKSTKVTSSVSGSLFRYLSTYFLQPHFRSHCLMIVLWTNDIFYNRNLDFFYSPKISGLIVRFSSILKPQFGCHCFIARLQLTVLQSRFSPAHHAVQLLLISLSLSLSVCLSPSLLLHCKKLGILMIFHRSPSVFEIHSLTWLYCSVTCWLVFGAGHGFDS